MTVHRDRLVRTAQFDGRTVIVKRYLAGDGTQIYEDMRLLWDSSFGHDRRPPGLPEPIAWLPEFSDLVMEHIAGPPLGARGDIGSSIAQAGGLAALLADLHSSNVPLARVRTARGVARSAERKATEMCSTRFREVAEALASTPADDGELVPSHGDFSPRNVLCSPEGLRLIDADRLQLASPARDVAYWGCWIWATMLLAGATPSWSPAYHFVDRYLDQRPASSAEIERGWGFHRAAGLLRIAHGWSALREDPALRDAVIAAAAALV